MKYRNRIILLLLATVFFTSYAQAGLISAIGDVDAVTINARPDNVVLLDNILGDNTNVLIIGEWANNGRITSLNAHWDALAGVSVTATTTIDITGAGLAGFDFLVYMEDAFSTNTTNATTRTAISNFIASGNDFLYVSQNLSNATRSASYNSFLTDIGSSLGTSTGSCHDNETVVADPLTVGVSNFVLNGCNEVTGGTALVTGGPGSLAGVAYEYVGGRVPSPAPIALIALGLAGLGFSRKNAGK